MSTILSILLFSFMSFATTGEWLAKIEQEGKGIVPASALAYWLSMQREGGSSIDSVLSIDPVTRKTLAAIRQRHEGTPLAARIGETFIRGYLSLTAFRSFCLDHIQLVELALRAEGKTAKSKRDFSDEFEKLRLLYVPYFPLWYTFERFDADQFVGLLAIPINLGNLAREVNYADGIELPPEEFLFHGESHALAAMPAFKLHFERLGIKPGSEAFYQQILARLRWTKQFLAWAESLGDPDLRTIVKALWFDAFHEVNAARGPSYRNYYPTNANLRLYINRNVSESGKIKLMARVNSWIGRSVFNRFTPGDFLAPDSASEGQYTREKITRGFILLREFAKQAECPELLVKSN